MAPILERIVRLRREATAVLLRLAPATLGLLAVVLSSVGANGAALGVLLLAGPFAAAAGLYVVLQVVDHERSRASALPAALSLLLLVAAAATRRPELALGCLPCVAADQLRFVSWPRPRAVGIR
jgi:hypothetical protein